MMSTPQTGHEASGAPPALDLSERGTRDKRPISLNRRLFVKFTAFGDCADAGAAVDAAARAGVTGALYLDAHDPRGIGLVAVSEAPEYFVTDLRALLNGAPFAGMRHKAEFDMLGRTYTIGYEADLHEVLFRRPISRITDPALGWAVWYPLQRAKTFATLPETHQRRILGEHGALGRRFAEAGFAYDIRLACHGLDKHDNDFVVGLVGAEIFPLSAIVQAMRRTEQTSAHLSSLGPFFVGRVAWQSPRDAAV